MSQELPKLLIDAKNNYGNSMGIPYNDFIDIVKEAYTLGTKERQEFDANMFETLEAKSWLSKETSKSYKNYAREIRETPFTN